jgi:hypothetical protein
MISYECIKKSRGRMPKELKTRENNPTDEDFGVKR